MNGTVKLPSPSHRESDSKTIILVHLGVTVDLMNEHAIKAGVGEWRIG